MSDAFPLALFVSASADVVRGCCGRSDIDCTCTSPTAPEESP